MQTPSIIRKVLAVFFVLLFAFSITPKRTLHNIVANHTDGRSSSSNNDPFHAQIAGATINCQCENLISESPFVADCQLSFTIPVKLFVEHKSTTFSSVFSAPEFSYSLRGPPAC